MIDRRGEIDDRERFILQLTVLFATPNSHISLKNKEMVHKLFRVASGLTEAEIVEIQKSVHNEFDKLEKFFAEALGISCLLYTSPSPRD